MLFNRQASYVLLFNTVMAYISGTLFSKQGLYKKLFSIEAL